jgi:hypothetical protein
MLDGPLLPTSRDTSTRDKTPLPIQVPPQKLPLPHNLTSQSIPTPPPPPSFEAHRGQSISLWTFGTRLQPLWPCTCLPLRRALLGSGCLPKLVELSALRESPSGRGSALLGRYPATGSGDLYCAMDWPLYASKEGGQGKRPFKSGCGAGAEGFPAHTCGLETGRGRGVLSSGVWRGGFSEGWREVGHPGCGRMRQDRRSTGAERHARHGCF